jgi:hypothetical protein
MYLRIIGNGFTQNILKEIEAITDSATLFFRNVKYDEKEKIIFLPIERYRIKRRKKLLGLITPYSRNMNIAIPSSIVIRNVTNCGIEDNSEIEDTKVTLLFGLTIKDNEMFICSVEEDIKKGASYSITLKVSEIDIEISDKNE